MGGFYSDYDRGRRAIRRGGRRFFKLFVEKEKMKQMETDWIKYRNNIEVESEALRKADDLLCLLSSLKVKGMEIVDGRSISITQSDRKASHIVRFDARFFLRTQFMCS